VWPERHADVPANLSRLLLDLARELVFGDKLAPAFLCEIHRGSCARCAGWSGGSEYVSLFSKAACDTERIKDYRTLNPLTGSGNEDDSNRFTDVQTVVRDNGLTRALRQPGLYPDPPLLAQSLCVSKSALTSSAW
jgi:hypothetical protein